MKIEVEADKCIASGQCVVIAEQLFDQDEDGIVVVLEAEPGDEVGDVARKAASVCPARVIHLRD